MSSTPAVAAAPSKFVRILAYGAIYFLWGASFLAIRIIVAAVPPLLAAGVRFSSAGLILFLWAAGTIWSQLLPLPSSKPMAASIQMVLGGVTLTVVSLADGDLSRFSLNRLDGHVIFSMVYLVLGASIVAFTAYVWLLGHDQP